MRPRGEARAAAPSTTLGPARDPADPEARTHLLHGARKYLSTEFINACATIGGVALFSHLVAPAIYGAYAVAVAAGGVGAAVAGEWLQASTLRYLSAQRRRAHRGVFTGAFLELTATSAAVLVLPAAIALVLLHDHQARVLALVTLAYAALTLSFLELTTIFQANLDPRRFAWYRSAFAVGRVVAGALLVLAVGASPVALLGGAVVTLAVLVPLAFAHVLRVGRRHAAGVRRRVARRAILAYGLPLVLWYAASQTLNLSDRFFLQGAWGSHDVGIYAVAYALATGTTTTVLQPILSAVTPILVRTWAKEGPTAASGQLSGALAILIVIAPLLVLGLFAFGRDVLAILAPRSYQSPSALIGVLGIAIAAWNAGLYVQKALELDLRSPALVRALALAAIVDVVLNIVLIPRFGMVGAAIATVFGYSVYLALVIHRARKILRLTIRMRTVVTVVTASGMFAGVVALVDLYFGAVPSIPRVLVGAPLAAFAYGAVVLGRRELAIVMHGLSGPAS